jgi:hypothetical protein
MPIAIVGSAEVPWSQVCTHWTGWQKPSGPVLSFRLELSHSEVITKFGKFWSEFNDRESEDDGTEIPPGLYSSLQSLGYPSLQAMLSMHTRLFEQLVLKDLQTEFLGYLVGTPTQIRKELRGFFLHSLHSVSVSKISVLVAGGCCEFQLPPA